MFHTSVTKLSLENQSLDVQYRCILFNSNSLFVQSLSGQSGFSALCYPRFLAEEKSVTPCTSVISPLQMMLVILIY